MDHAVSTQDKRTISIIKKGTYLIVNAKLNGMTRKFVLDGSSDKTLLNSKYIQREAHTSEKAKNIDFYGIKLNKPDLETMDMSYIEDVTGVKVYGILGYDVIKFCDLAFDYQKQTITLFTPPKDKEQVSSPTPKKKMQWIFPFIPL